MNYKQNTIQKKKINKYSNKKDGLISWAFDTFLPWVDPMLKWLPKKIEFIGLFIALTVSLPIVFIFGLPQMMLFYFNRFFKNESLLNTYKASVTAKPFKKSLDIG